MPWLAFFHMTTHALFKALLFICVGSFINYHSHSQDLRWMGGISTQIPVIVSCLLISNLALCGFPFLAGFYSKDIIIEYILHSTMRELLIEISLFRLGLTSFYSTRALIVGVISPKLVVPFITITEPKAITTPAIFLAISAITIGATLRWMYPIYTNITVNCSIGKSIPLVYILAGFISSFILSTHKSIKSCSLFTHPLTNSASCSIWFLVPLSTQFIIKIPFSSTHQILKTVDHGWKDLITRQGHINKLINTANYIIALSPFKPNTLLLSSISSICAAVPIIIRCFNSLKKALHWSWNDDLS